MIINSQSSQTWKRPYSPSPVLLFALALAIQAEVTDARGGGGGGRGGGGGGGGGKSSSSSSKGGSKGSKSKSGSAGAPVVVVGSGSHRKCYDKDGKLIKCPSNKKTAIIAASVVGGLVGLTLIGVLIYWFLKRRKQRRSVTQEAPIRPTPQSRKNTKEKDYLKLEDSPA